MPGEVRYAGYPDAFIYSAPKKAGGKVKQHLLWGDWLEVTGDADQGFLPVKARGGKGWISQARVQKAPLLEVTFVDIGQGDGCVVSAPGEEAGSTTWKHLLVDAGQFDNMRRYLDWRFNLRRRKQHFHAAVITHPDQDHYLGFRDLFEDPNVTFGSVLHNGIVETTSGLGQKAVGEQRYIEPVVTQEALSSLLGGAVDLGKKQYPNMLKQALGTGRVGSIRAVSAGELLPGFEGTQPITIEVLGPVPDRVEGKPMLRDFGDDGKTKNGHSVVLRLRYDKVTLLLGGDLNSVAEDHLLAHYAGGRSGEEKVQELRRRLGCDVAKACHHGTADFSAEFLAAVNPLATVISSGDEEPHAHPRADALGAIGKASRGPRPLIFSTELARSAKETIKHPNALRRDYAKLFDQYVATTNADERAKIRKKIDDKLGKDLERSIATYGAINLRTDGERVVIAYRLEKESQGRRWDLYRLERGASGELVYRSRSEPAPPAT